MDMKKKINKKTLAMLNALADELEQGDTTNVFPINDLKPHTNYYDCWCRPKAEVQPNGKVILIHNSMDGRELKENGKKSN